MIRFELGSNPPNKDNFEHASDLWPVLHMLNQTDYEVLEIDDEKLIFDGERNESFQMEVEYLNLSDAKAAFHIQESGMENFDPTSNDYDPSHPYFWELMTGYSFLMEKERGLEPGEVFSTQNNAANMKQQLKQFQDGDIIKDLEDFGWYKVDPQEHARQLRGADILRELDNVITRLRRRGAIDYDIQLLENQQAAAIESGGYKFLTKLYPEAPYNNAQEAIEFRY